MFDQIITAGSGNNEEEKNLPAAPPPELESEESFIGPEPPTSDEVDENSGAVTPPPPKKKRNSGRTGATTPEGRLRCSQNAIKHGACAETLLLPGESEPAWRIVLARWCDENYISAEEQALVNTAHCPSCTTHSLTYDFVRRVAEADWHRIRCTRAYAKYARMFIEGRVPYNWTPDDVKMHDLHLRYKNAAERAFHRENRALQQHIKFSQEQKRWHQQEQEKEKEKAALAAAQSQPPASPPPTAAPPTPKRMPPFRVLAVDHDSPTGYSIISEIIDGVEMIQTPRPIEPPNPIPAHWPKPSDFPIKKSPPASGAS